MKKDLKYKFGKKIKLERTKRDWSQEVLAEKAGLHRVVVGQIERSEISTTLDSIEKLAKAFDILPKNLFDFSDILQ